jgi:hypothetical protein
MFVVSEPVCSQYLYSVHWFGNELSEISKDVFLNCVIEDNEKSVYRVLVAVVPADCQQNH